MATCLTDPPINIVTEYVLQQFDYYKIVEFVFSILSALTPYGYIFDKPLQLKFIRLGARAKTLAAIEKYGTIGCYVPFCPYYLVPTYKIKPSPKRRKV